MQLYKSSTAKFLIKDTYRVLECAKGNISVLEKPAEVIHCTNDVSHEVEKGEEPVRGELLEDPLHNRIPSIRLS